MFLSPDKSGQMTIYQTSGNPYGHVIMRGGKKPNFYAEDIAAACATLREFDLPEQLVVDFSHGNCQKQHRRQLEVCDDICEQIRGGSTAIAGVMAESFLQEGTQKIVKGQPLVYGQSITDPCLSWEDSEVLLENSLLPSHLVCNSFSRRVSRRDALPTPNDWFLKYDLQPTSLILIIIIIVISIQLPVPCRTRISRPLRQRNNRPARQSSFPRIAESAAKRYWGMRRALSSSIRDKNISCDRRTPGN
jgi:hypothetical protein